MLGAAPIAFGRSKRCCRAFVVDPKELRLTGGATSVARSDGARPLPASREVLTSVVTLGRAGYLVDHARDGDRRFERITWSLPGATAARPMCRHALASSRGDSRSVHSSGRSGRRGESRARRSARLERLERDGSSHSTGIGCRPLDAKRFLRGLLDAKPLLCGVGGQPRCFDGASRHNHRRTSRRPSRCLRSADVVRRSLACTSGS
jgi:hypothetical protein